MCLPAGGVRELALRSNDPEAKRALEEAANCNSGSLVAFDKETGKSIEPKLEPPIAVVEEPRKGYSGPGYAELKRRMGPHTKSAIVLRYADVVSPLLSLFAMEAAG